MAAVASRSESVHRLPAALDELLRSLQVDPGNARLDRRRHRDGQSFLALPSTSRPNLLVPMHRRGAVVVEERAASGFARRVLRGALTTGLRSGVVPTLPLRRLHVDDPRLAELTRWLAGAQEGPVQLGIMLGPPRANRKAVVRVLSESGETISYAKIGTTPLTRSLVRAEAENLTALACDPPELGFPRALRFRDDDHMTVLVTSPLTRLRAPTELPHRQTRALFRRHEDLSTPLEQVPLFAADCFTPGYAALGSIANLADARARLMKAIGESRLPLGDSHGDWAPQNMSESSHGLDVWDWERYTSGVPQGLDAIHFEAALVDVRPGELARTETRFLDRLPGVLARCGIDPSTTRPLLCLYLLWVAGRYDSDLSLSWSSSTEARLRWVARLLESQLRRLESEKGRR